MFLTGQPCFNVDLPTPRLSLTSPWMWEAEERVNSRDRKKEFTSWTGTDPGYYSAASFHRGSDTIVFTSPPDNSVSLYSMGSGKTKQVAFSLSSSVAVQGAQLVGDSLYIMGDTDVLIYNNILGNQKYLNDSVIEAASLKSQISTREKLICDIQISAGSLSCPLKGISIWDGYNSNTNTLLSVCYGNVINTYDIVKETLVSRAIMPCSNITQLCWTDLGLFAGTNKGELLMFDHKIACTTSLSSGALKSKYVISNDSILPAWGTNFRSPISALTSNTKLQYLFGIGTLGGDISVIDLRYVSDTFLKSSLADMHGYGPISSLGFSEHHVQYMSASSAGNVSLIDLSHPEQSLYTIHAELNSDGLTVPKALSTSMMHETLSITTAFDDGRVQIHHIPKDIAAALSRRANRRMPETSLVAERTFGTKEEEDLEIIDDMLAKYHSGNYPEALEEILNKAHEYCMNGDVNKSEQMLVLIDMLENHLDNEDDNDNDNEDEDDNENNKENGDDLIMIEDIDKVMDEKPSDSRTDFQRLVLKYGSFDLSEYNVPEEVFLIRNTIRTVCAGLVFVTNNTTPTLSLSNIMQSYLSSKMKIPHKLSLISPEDIILSGITSLGVYFYKTPLQEGISLREISQKEMAAIKEKKPYERLFSSLLLSTLHVLLISVGDALSAIFRLRSLIQTWRGGFENTLSPLSIILETLLMPSIFSQDSGYSLEQMVSILQSVLGEKGKETIVNIQSTMKSGVDYLSDIVDGKAKALLESENEKENEKTQLIPQNFKLKSATRWKSITADESTESTSSSSVSEQSVEENISERLSMDISTPPDSDNNKDGASHSDSLDINYTLDNEPGSTLNSKKGIKGDNGKNSNENKYYELPTSQYGTTYWCARELFKECGKAILTPFKGTDKEERQSPMTIYKALEDEAERIVALRQKVDADIATSEDEDQTLQLQQNQKQNTKQSPGSGISPQLFNVPSRSGNKKNINDDRSNNTSKRVAKARMPVPGAGDSELYRIFWLLSNLGTDITPSPNTQPTTAALLTQFEFMLNIAENKTNASSLGQVMVSAPLFLCTIGELLEKRDFQSLRKTMDIHFRMVLEARGLKYKYVDVERAGKVTAPFELTILEICKKLVWPLLIDKVLTPARVCSEACTSLELLLKYLGFIPTLLVLNDLPFLTHLPALIITLARQFSVLFQQARQGITFGDVENIATLIRKVSQIHFIEVAGLKDALTEARDNIESLLNLKQKH